MFHWICPECGREIAPTVRECPACDGADTAELVLAGVVEASARTLSSEASGRASNVETSLAAVESTDKKPQDSALPVNGLERNGDTPKLNGTAALAETPAGTPAAQAPRPASGLWDRVKRQAAQAPPPLPPESQAKSETKPEVVAPVETAAAVEAAALETAAASEIAAVPEVATAPEVVAAIVPAIVPAVIPGNEAALRDLDAGLKAEASVVAIPPAAEKPLIPEILDAKTAVDQTVERAIEARAAALLFGASMRERQEARDHREPGVPVDEPEQPARSVRSKTVEGKSVESKAVESRVIETKQIDTRQIETNPVDARPVDARLVDVKPVESRPVETNAVDAVAETRVAETKAAETKSVETNSVEAVAETKAVEPKPVEPVDAVTAGPEAAAAPPVESPAVKSTAVESSPGESPASEKGVTESRPEESDAAESAAGTAEAVESTLESEAKSKDTPDSAPRESTPSESTRAESKDEEVKKEEVKEAAVEAVQKESAPPQQPAAPAIDRVPLIGKLSRMLLPAIAAPNGKAGDRSKAAPEAAPPVSEPSAPESAAAPEGVKDAPTHDDHAAKAAVEAKDAEDRPDGKTPTAGEKSVADAVPISAESLRALESAVAIPEAEAKNVEPTNVEPIDPPVSGILPLSLHPKWMRPVQTPPSAVAVLVAGNEVTTSPERASSLDIAAVAPLTNQLRQVTSEPALAETRLPLAPPSPRRITDVFSEPTALDPKAGAVRAPRSPARRPMPRMARMVKYSPLAKRMICPAAPEEGMRGAQTEPRVTLPGPMLTRSLVSFLDRELAPIFVEQRAFRKRFVSMRMLVLLLGFTVLGVTLSNMLSYVRPDARPQSAESAAPVAASAAPLHVTGANPLSKSIEITGFRIVADPTRKSEVQYLVVNHSPLRFSDATVYVTLHAADARLGQPPLYRFSFAAPNLGPFESKEMVSAVEKTTRTGNLPEWQDLRAEIEIGR